MLAAAKAARSPSIYPALTLALNAGMRDAEIRHLQWDRVDFEKGYLTVGDSKTEAGEGRTIPLNSALMKVLAEYRIWFEKRFGPIQPAWYVFASGRPRPNDPTRPIMTLNTSWSNVRKKANVTGRWHDNRHTLITDLAESGAGEETIRSIAGHVSPQMLKHYSPQTGLQWSDFTSRIEEYQLGRRMNPKEIRRFVRDNLLTIQR